jgi:hypothetical protein
VSIGAGGEDGSEVVPVPGVRKVDGLALVTR